MEDRNLFRGKGYNGWFYGSLIESEHGHVYIMPKHAIEEDGHHIRQGDDIPYWVDPETVGQHTSAFDKHKTPIYSGDIIKAIVSHDAAFPKGAGYYEEIGVVEYSTGYLGYAITNNGYRGRLGRYATNTAEVLGNVYENGELLEGDSENENN